MEKMIEAYEAFYKRFIPYLIAIPLVIMTVVIFINVIGRKLSMPFPVTVELVEALLVVSVYFGVALVALEGGHVNVDFRHRQIAPQDAIFCRRHGQSAGSRCIHLPLGVCLVHCTGFNPNVGIPIGCLAFSLVALQVIVCVWIDIASRAIGV